MSWLPGKKVGISFFVLMIVGVFFLSANWPDALAYHETTTYEKLFNDTLTSDEWNDLFDDFVNTWQPVSMSGPLGIGMAAPSNGRLAVDGRVGIGTATPDFTLDVNTAELVNYTISAGNKRIGNVAMPAEDADVATKGYLDASLVGGSGLTVGYWALDGNNLFASSTSWNVGIGTTNPITKLNVIGVGQFLASGDEGKNSRGITLSPAVHSGIQEIKTYGSNRTQINAYNTGTGLINAGIEFNVGGGSIGFITSPYGVAGEERVRINNAGNVGIGTTAPEGILHLTEAPGAASSVMYNDVYTTFASGSPVYMYRKSNSNTLGVKTATNNGDRLGLFGWQGVDSGSNFDYGAAITVYQDGTAGTRVPARLELYTFSDSASNSPQLVLAPNGNIGIGTTAPGAKLDIRGVNANFWNISGTANGNYANAVFGEGVSAGQYAEFIRYSNASPVGVFPGDFIVANLNKKIIFSTAYSGGYRGDLVINSSGNVGIGTTAPEAALEINTAEAINYTILAGGKRVGDVALPVEDYDVVTKGYVDATFVPAGTSTIAVFIGVTTDTYNGNNNGTDGYATAHAICALEYAGSHVCATFELLNFMENGGTPPAQDAWIFSGPPGYTALANDCDARTDNTSAAYGTYWQKPATGYPEGRGLLMQCNNSIRFACCQ